MSKKNVFLLAIWYVAGWLISSFYNKKKPEELKKDLEKSKSEWEGEFKVILNNFLETHENLINDLKTHIMTDKNKEIYHAKKEELLKLLETYKIQWMELLEELKIKWKDFISEASEKLEILYNKKIVELESLKEIAPEKIKEIKESLKESYNEIKSKIK